MKWNQLKKLTEEKKFFLINLISLNRQNNKKKNKENISKIKTIFIRFIRNYIKIFTNIKFYLEWLDKFLEKIFWYLV